jgi:hypothetical protein
MPPTVPNPAANREGDPLVTTTLPPFELAPQG